MIERALQGLSVMTVLRVALVVLLVLACLEIIRPFIGALLWGVIIAVSVWPAFVWLRARLQGRTVLAASMMVVAMMLAMAVPLALMLLTLAESVPMIADQVHLLSGMPLPPAPDWLRSLPMVGNMAAGAWENARADLPGLLEKARPTINKTALWALGKGADLSISLLEIVLAICVSGLMLARGEEARRLAIRVADRLGGASVGTLPQVITKMIRGVTAGVIGTALAQTVLCVIGLLIAGVPGSLVLGFLCFMMAVAQLPTLLVWLPAALWVLYTGHTGMGIFLLLWGFLLVNTIDNILKPILISQGVNLPMWLILLGVIGGLLAWGMIGLFIGPTLLAVGYTLFRLWLDPAIESRIVLPADAGAVASEDPPAQA